MREQSVGIREQPGWRAEGRGEGRIQGPPSSCFSLAWLSRESQNRFRGETKMLLSLLEGLVHTRTGGEVAKFRRKKRCPLSYPTLSTFHPFLSFPCGPSPCCTWGSRGMRKGFKVPAGLLADMVEPRQGPPV